MPDEIGARAADLLLVCGGEARVVANDEKIGSLYNQRSISITSPGPGMLSPSQADLIQTRVQGQDQIIALAVWVAGQERGEAVKGDGTITHSAYFNTPARAALGRCMGARRLDQIAGATLQAPRPDAAGRPSNAYLADTAARGIASTCVGFQEPNNPSSALLNRCPAAAVVYYCFEATSCRAATMNAVFVGAGGYVYLNSGGLPAGAEMRYVACWADQAFQFDRIAAHIEGRGCYSP